MSDIKIPSHTEGIGHEKPGFLTRHLHEAPAQEEKKMPEPSTQVKVPFEKFVQLVATHDFEAVMSKHANEDIVLSTSLLTDLANAYPEDSMQKTKTPVMLILGVIIGIVVTYLILRL